MTAAATQPGRSQPDRSQPSRERTGGDKRWGQRLVIGLALFLVAGALVLGGMNLTHSPSAPKRQVAHIMVLPDAPPPPPPPPDDKKPPPKEEQNRQQQQIATPKQEAPPAPPQLKMEGTAGEGPSAFASGEVKQDYIGGEIGNGSRYSAYVAKFEQLVQVELTRHNLHLSGVKLFVWLAPDGTIQRYKIEGGDAEGEQRLRLALADLKRADEAPLADMPMPIGLSVN